MPTFKSLYEENRDSLKLEWLAGRSSIDRPLDTPANAGLSSADLVGHLNLIHPNRLHVLGHPEVHYYLKLEPARRQYYARELIAGGPIGIVIGEGLAAPEELLAAAEAAALTTLSSDIYIEKDGVVTKLLHPMLTSRIYDGTIVLSARVGPGESTKEE